MNIIRYLQGERRGMGSQFTKPTYEQKIKSLFAPSISIPNIVLIPDVSFYQEGIDFVKMKAAGVDGVIIRAGQRYWVDPKFAINWVAAKDAGLLRGSYWFYDGREDPRKQAKLWYDQIKTDMGELVHVPDLEDGYGGTYANKASRKIFVSEFQTLSGLPNKKIIIYTGFYWWNENMGADSWFNQYRLWLAWYSPEEVVRIPAPWIESNLMLWQYTSSGDGSKYGVTSKEIDLSWYNGTPAQFAAEFGSVSEPEPPTGGTEMKYTLKNTGTSSLTIRGGASVLFGSTGSIAPGATVEGDFLEVYDVSLAVAGTTYGNKGDKWLHLTNPEGWAAVIHMGKPYGLLTEIPVPPATSESVWTKDEKNGLLFDVAEIKADIGNIAGALIGMTQAHSNMITALANLQAGMDELLTASPTIPPTASDGYTGPRMGVYEVIDVPSDPINQQWTNGAVPLFDDNGGDRLQIKEQLYDLWMNTLEGFKELVDSGTIVTDEKGIRFILGKAVKGQKLLIALQGKSDGVMKGQIVGFSNEDNPLVGAVNFASCTPDTTPWLFHKVKNVRRFIPIMTGNKGNNWWIPMSWLKKVA